MLIKIVLVTLLLAVIISMFMGMRNLTAKDPEQRKKMKTALTWRISLSLCIFVLILVASYFGYLKPHAL